jgi:3-oxoacyl-[acyl-carrier protein] reductase
MKPLASQVGVVTGAGRGIGSATARRLADDGAAVVVSDVDAASAEAAAARIRESGGDAMSAACDVTDPDAVAGLVASAVEAFGRLDILVCCAGVIRDNLIHKMTEGDWDTVVDTHLKGTFLAAREAQRVMVAQRYGRMVFLSSVAALGSRGQANYSAAKAGLQAMAATLAIELGRFGITVNAIAPGWVETDMMRQSAERMGMSIAALVEKVAADIPVGRVGQPEDVAACVAFLAARESAYLSGQTLYLRGGP